MVISCCGALICTFSFLLFYQFDKIVYNRLPFGGYNALWMELYALHSHAIDYLMNQLFGNSKWKKKDRFKHETEKSIGNSKANGQKA